MTHRGGGGAQKTACDQLKSCLLSHVSYLLSHVSCLTSPVSCLTSSVSGILSHVSCLPSPALCPTMLNCFKQKQTIGTSSTVQYVAFNLDFNAKFGSGMAWKCRELAPFYFSATATPPFFSHSPTATCATFYSSCQWRKSGASAQRGFFVFIEIMINCEICRDFLFRKYIIPKR